MIMNKSQQNKVLTIFTTRLFDEENGLFGPDKERVDKLDFRDGYAYIIGSRELEARKRTDDSVFAYSHLSENSDNDDRIDYLETIYNHAMSELEEPDKIEQVRLILHGRTDLNYVAPGMKEIEHSWIIRNVKERGVPIDITYTFQHEQGNPACEALVNFDEDQLERKFSVNDYLSKSIESYFANKDDE